MRIGKHFSFLVWSFFVVGLLGITAKTQVDPTEDVKIAFLADVHFQDIYGHFLDTDYNGILNPLTGKHNTIRTMNAQLHSTRIFNENYFAFIAALDDVVKRGIKIVALPGDFSDDGQPVHLRGLQKILQSYADTYGIQFLAITGNHDPVRPFAKEGIKKDFLGENGMAQILTSIPMEVDPSPIRGLKPIVTKDIHEMGYEGILTLLSNFGFNPKRQYLYWETPFSDYGYDDYNYEKAVEASKLDRRTYQMATTSIKVPDASYLVEPIEGVWLMALDGNVYVPKDSLSGIADNPLDFNGAGAGYTQVLTYKSHLLKWAQKMTYEAQKRNKLLVAFSHYPMVEFNDGSSAAMRSFFGAGKMQLSRVPPEEVAEAFSKAGLKIHFGGHMHINDTGVYTSKNGQTLFNIQVPSIAAYIPAYKILTVHNSNKVGISTIQIKNVAEYDQLFPLYEREYAYLSKLSDVVLWDKAILNSKSYGEFVQLHLKELVRLRFIPEDWPNNFANKITQSTGAQLLKSSLVNIGISEIKAQLRSKGMRMKTLEQWTGFDMIYDYYRLRGGDELAIPSIGPERLEQYLYVCERLALSSDPMARLWAHIFTKTAKEYPADHFMIDFSKNQIYPLNQVFEYKKEKYFKLKKGG